MELIHLSEKAMSPHSSTLAWKIPWAEEPGRLQSMGLLRVGHNWEISLSLFTFMHWRRKWQPTPVFLPGKSQRRRSLVGCHLWGCTESDTTEAAVAAAAAYICTTQSSPWPSEHYMMSIWSATNEVSCYIVIIYKTWGERAWTYHLG